MREKGMAQGSEGTDRGFRVLIVDDDEAICRLFSVMLVSRYPELGVDTVCEGGEAAGCFRAHHHSLLVLDVNLPDSSGELVFRSIEGVCLERGWDVPAVVFCSGLALPEGVRAIVGDGTRHKVLAKPLTQAGLLAAVQDALGLE